MEKQSGISTSFSDTKTKIILETLLTCCILQGLCGRAACGDDNSAANRISLGASAGAIDNAARCFKIRCRRRSGRQVGNGLCTTMLWRQYSMVYGTNATDCCAVSIRNNSSNRNATGCIHTHAACTSSSTACTATTSTRSWSGACAELHFINARAFHHAWNFRF